MGRIVIQTPSEPVHLVGGAGVTITHSEDETLIQVDTSNTLTGIDGGGPYSTFREA